MKRIKNIDLLRAGAILYIMLYHCYTLSGKPWHAHTAIHTFLSFGGEVGVTLFFLSVDMESIFPWLLPRKEGTSQTGVLL